MTGYKSKKAAASAKTIDEVNWADHELDGLAQPAQEPVTTKDWEGAEYWMPLAWALCAEEYGEDACKEIIWDGGAIPEPWGEQWLKYEDEAKRMIAMVQEHALPQPAQEFKTWAGVDFDIHTTPPQRTWVGLTDEDYNDIFKKARTGEHAVQLAEARLKEKNNGT